MTLASKIFPAILLPPRLGFAAWSVACEMRASNEREVTDREIPLVQAGRYLQTVHVIEAWMNSSRREVSDDGSHVQPLAAAYFAKAWSKPAGKHEYLLEADRNLQKAQNSLGKG